MKLSDFEALSFDCYGTLIDWETGIWEALRSWSEGAGAMADREALLAAFARHETRVQTENPEMPYPEVLASVIKAAAADLGARCSDGDAARFGASVADWPAFPDSAPALAYLKGHYTLVILSNVDRQSFKASNARLGVEFDAIVTAQDVGSYKPDSRNFEALLEAMRRLGVAKDRVLHTAESLYHDHVPAKRIGLATAWIHRRHDQGGFGATAPSREAVAPDFRFTTLGEMAAAHRAEAAASGD